MLHRHVSASYSIPRRAYLQTIPCYLALFILAEYVYPIVVPLSRTHHPRLFEIFMAYDALRLRNVIQLVGILRASFRLSGVCVAANAHVVNLSLPCGTPSHGSTASA